MARKMRFPLEMRNGVRVRSLEEFIENFDIEKVLLYVDDGKLERWLRDRFRDDLANAIGQLPTGVDDFVRVEKICHIFNVPEEHITIDLEVAKVRNQHRNLLKQFTDDKEILDAVDSVAFSQDDLHSILNNGEKKVYLFGEKFEIPLQEIGITYVGLNNPMVTIHIDSLKDWEAKGITIENCLYDDKYSELLEKHRKESLERADVFLNNMNGVPELLSGRHHTDTGIFQLVGNEMKKLPIDLGYFEYEQGVLQCGNKLYYVNNDVLCPEMTIGLDEEELEFLRIDCIKEYDIETKKIRDISFVEEIQTLLCIRNNILFLRSFCRLKLQHKLCLLNLETLEKREYKTPYAEKCDAKLWIDSQIKLSYFEVRSYSVTEYDLEDNSLKNQFSIRGELMGARIADNKLIAWSYASNKGYCTYMDLESKKVIECDAYTNAPLLRWAIFSWDWPIGVTCYNNKLYWVRHYNVSVNIHPYVNCLEVLCIDLSTNQFERLGEIQYRNDALDSIINKCQFIDIRNGYIYMYEHSRFPQEIWTKKLPELRVEIATGKIEILKSKVFVPVEV